MIEKGHKIIKPYPVRVCFGAPLYPEQELHQNDPQAEQVMNFMQKVRASIHQLSEQL